MELRQLRYFVAVAEELNLQKASRRLHICAPPLWLQMRKLQELIGVALFRRTQRGRLELTDAGGALLDEARAMLASVEHGVMRVRQVANREAGRLIIGCNAVAEFGVLPYIVAAFRRARPQVELVLRSVRTPQQLPDLQRDALDVGFICPPITAGTLDLHELTRQPFVAALPEDHPLSEAAAVSFEALSEAPMITYSRALDPHSFEQIQTQFQRAQVPMRVAYEAETAFAMLALTRAGNGCCIVPEYAHQFAPRGVVCRPLAASPIVRTLAVVKRKERQGLAATFFQFVIEQVARMRMQAPPLTGIGSGEGFASLALDQGQGDSIPSMAGGG